MPSVSELCGYLDQLAPSELGEEWDNVGLLVGRGSAQVERVLTCLTLTADVAAEAIQEDVQLIVSHHPVLFRGAQSISDHNVEGRLLLDLIEAGVAVFSAHTRFDSARQGINQRLATGFGLQAIAPIRPHADQADLGSGRIGRLLQPCPLHSFLAVVRAVCDGRYLEYCGEPDAEVHKVAVACGSAAEFLDDAVAAGCDTFVTGEARFHSALEARGRGISLILTGHYSSERPAMEWLATELNREFDTLRVFASSAESDPLRLFVE